MAQAPDLQPPQLAWVAQKQLRTARKNCLAVFVAFLVAFVFAVYWTILVGDLGGDLGDVAIGGGLGLVFTWVIGLYAAIYVPLRWRVIGRLSPTIKILGLIGSAGLLGMMLTGAVVALLVQTGRLQLP